MIPLTCLHLLQRIALLSVILASIGCLKQRDTGPRGAERYRLGAPGAGWQPMDPLSADDAWYHADRSATIYADASCGARYEDGELDALLKHLTFGIAKGEPLRDEALTLDSRAALVRSFDGQLDGVSVRVGAMVTKKNDCLYDVLYIAPPPRFDEGWTDFVQVVQGFAVGR